MARFTTEIKLQNKSVFINELKVKHFKILLKSLLGDNPDPKNVLYNLLNILTEITSLSLKQLKSFTIIDFLILIVYIRCISIGSSIQLEIKGEKNTKITLNLNKVIDILEVINSYNFVKKIDNITVEYQIPSIHNFILFNDYDNDIFTIKNYIKKLKLKDDLIIDVTSISNNNFSELFNFLPANYSTQIFKHVTEIISYLNQINLLSYFKNENYILRLNSNTIIFILQILFSKNLYPLYENVFALCKFANFSPSYIEECTPGEYIIYTKMLERFIKEQNAQSKTQATPLIKNKAPEFM